MFLVSSRNGVKYLTTALAVYPFEEPGIGPNCDDNVLYQIHVATGTDVAKGKPTLFLRPTHVAWRDPNSRAHSFLKNQFETRCLCIPLETILTLAHRRLFKDLDATHGAQNHPDPHPDPKLKFIPTFVSSVPLW